MIRFCDSFALVDPAQARLKYSGYTATLDQDTLITGRDGYGKAFVIQNTAFGEANYLVTMDPQGVWGFHADVQITKLGTGASLQTCDWFTWRHTSLGAQLLLRVLADGRLRLISHTGATVATSSFVLVIDTWYTIEVKAQFGGSGQAEVRVNGVAVLTGAGFTPLALPDQVGFRWQVFGPPSLAVGNLVIWDGQTSGVHDFTGRIRIEALKPISEAAPIWVGVPGPGIFPMVNDAQGRTGGCPDGDLTYMQPFSAASQLFTMDPAVCFGYVWGVALTAVARPAGSIYAILFRVQPKVTQYTMDTIFPTTVAYRAYQAIAETNPDQAAAWTDAVISGSYWGLQMNPAAVTRVSQFYLEKITSLEAIPFNCGSGSYSF